MASFLISKTKTSTIFLIVLYCYRLTFIKKSCALYCYPFTLAKDLFISYLHNINLLTISITTYCINYAMSYNDARSLEGYFSASCDVFILSTGYSTAVNV